MNEHQETSKSGSPIYRHENRERDWVAPEGQGESLEAIEAHVERHIGPIETVYHEVVSDLVHIDVLFVKATADRPYHVLVTSGASDLPMNTPEGVEGLDRAELMIALPSTWPLTEEAFKEEEHYWPIRSLKFLARLPHEYDTWIGWGHTIPNGDPPGRIGNTQFVGIMITVPSWLGEDFCQIDTTSGDKITVYELMPLYEEEMKLKLDRGAEHLEELLTKNDAWGALDVARPNVAKRRSWFRR